MTTWCSWHDMNFEHHDETTMATWGHDHMTVRRDDEGDILKQYYNMRTWEY